MLSRRASASRLSFAFAASMETGAVIGSLAH
jgi:hypothetical protein